MTINEQTVQWSVDSLVVRDGCLCAYGWCADSVAKIVKLELSLQYADGMIEAVPIQYGTPRPDVAEKNSSFPSASGFFAYAALSRNEAASSVWLTLSRADGTQQKLVCPVPEPVEQGWVRRWSQGFLPWRRLLGDAMRVFRLLRRGQWRTVWGHAKRLGAKLNSRAGSDEALRNAFSQLRPDAVLILDHSLGGGANKYSAELLHRLILSGRDVLVWTFTPQLLRHELSIHGGLGQTVHRFHLAWNKWGLLLASRKVSEVVFNNSVGFPNPEQVPEMLAAFRQGGAARLKLLLHDFNMACPSYFLLNNEGDFCGVPDVKQCRQCLPRINDGLVRLFAARDIDLWRSRWGGVLNMADEVVHFSPSSRDLFSRAYPDIRPEQWVFRPHRMDPPVGRFHYPETASGLRVAVVGQIGRHKGSEVILSLVAQAKRQGIDLHVVVVGTLEADEHSDSITQTGVYRPQDLAHLLNQNAVHMALMPSIWAETFSYVTHELIGLEVPLMAFDFGAQAETVSAYSRGRVIGFGSAEELLHELTNFKADLDRRDLS